MEIRRANQEEWTPLKLDDSICLGDSVRTLAFSRADIRVPDAADLRMGPESTATFQTSDDETRTLLSIIKGVFNFISRDSRSLKIETPYVNAGLRGTEFLVRVSGDDFRLVVYEGEVDLASESSELSVPGGKSISVSSGDFSQPLEDIVNRDELLWSLNYPQILAGPLPAAADPVPGASPAAEFFALRAQSRARVGQIEAARADIAAALAIEPDQAQALAVDAIIALAEGDRATAQRRLDQALGGSPYSAAALIAQTYLQMEQNALRAALATAQMAVQSDPGNPIAHARHADVLLALGEAREAQAAAEKALNLDPGLAAGYTGLGFAALAEGEIEASLRHFREAIQRDSAAALPRVGFAIALIRIGEPTDGRAQLEAAVILDANDSVVRSYVGKAYLDEMRTTLASAQIEVAQELDPSDPTGKLYGALANHAQNQSVAAYQNFNQAAAVNDNQLPFRSRLMQDEDLATRSAGIGQVYRSLGYNELALVAGSRALLASPADYSAHQLVGDVFSDLPRYQIVRINEIYQARMLQPHNVVPFAPQLAQINLSIIDSVGPAEIAHAAGRYSFARNGLQLLTSAVSGSNNSVGENLVLSGLSDRSSFNFGQFHYETDGFNENNDINHDVVTALFQSRPTSTTSFQLELRSSETDMGDQKLLFDRSNFNRLLRQHEESDSIRLGIAHRATPWTTILGSLTTETARSLANIGSSFSGLARDDTDIAELQILSERPRWTLVGGLRVMSSDFHETTMISSAIPIPPFSIDFTTDDKVHSRDIRSYFYATRELNANVFLTAGASIDRHDGWRFSADRTSPKLGLTWRPGGGDTSIRLAAFETLQGLIVSKQRIQPSLEPSLVGGFGQFPYATEAEQASNFGIGLDHVATVNLRFTLDYLERDLSVPFLRIDSPVPVAIEDVMNVDEVTSTANVYWTPLRNVALKAGWQYEDFDYNGNSSPYSFSRLRTRRLPLSATVFVGSAISARFSGTLIDQDGLFVAPTFLGEIYPGSSRFWIFNAAVDYRLPNRHGSVEIGIKNLFDEAFQFQDTDPENTRVFPDRFLMGRFSLSF